MVKQTNEDWTLPRRKPITKEVLDRARSAPRKMPLHGSTRRRNPGLIAGTARSC